MGSEFPVAECAVNILVVISLTVIEYDKPDIVPWETKTNLLLSKVFVNVSHCKLFWS